MAFLMVFHELSESGAWLMSTNRSPSFPKRLQHLAQVGGGQRTHARGHRVSLRPSVHNIHAIEPQGLESGAHRQGGSNEPMVSAFNKHS